MVFSISFSGGTISPCLFLSESWMALDVLEVLAR